MIPDNKYVLALIWSVLISAVTGACISPQASAAFRPATAKFHGTILVVECTVNADKRQTVNFGDAVGIHKVDGKRYLQSVPFDVSCNNYSGGSLPAMTLTIEGTATTFNSSAVETNVAGLGIQIQRDGKAQELNQAVKFDVNNTPVLTAVPVKDPNTELGANPFKATVKLKVDIA